MSYKPTLRRRMLISLACTVLGAITIGVGSLLAVNGMHQDMSVSVQGYRQLRQIFDVGFLASKAREAISSNPPQPRQAIAALNSAMAKLDERSEPSAVDGPPARWVDESSRRDCRSLLLQSINQLSTGGGGAASLNLTFGQLSRVAEDVRRSIAESQKAADDRQHEARTIVVVIDGAVIVIALLIGGWQYRRVVDPIRQLTQGVRAFTAGELDQRLDLTGDLEFVVLAGDFNKMATELSALYRDLEAKVAEKTRLLVRSEQLASVGLLAASVAHEINNPLGIIAGYSERAIQRLRDSNGAVGGSPGSESAALQVICEEAFRCKQITDRLLSLARPGSSERSIVSLAAIAEMVVATLSGLGRQVSLTADTTADYAIRASEGEIKQLLLNLLMNSIEAVDPAQGKIAVKIHRTGDEVILSVQDNGHGMTSETIDRIFQPFYSEKRGSRRGTGLGLSIAQTIAVEHGGTLSAHSDGLGAGSTFTLVLPAAKPEPIVAGS